MLVVSAVSLLAILQCLLRYGSATSRTGSFTTQPFDAQQAMGFTYSFYGEGMEYDTSRDQVLLGTLNSGGTSVAGKIFGVPYYSSTNGEGRVVYSEDDMTTVFGGDSTIKSIAGLQMDPSDSDIVWAATGYFPPTDSTPCGAAKINIATGQMELYYDFTPFRSAYGNNKCMSNDLIFDENNNLYVTDFYGYQIIKVAGAAASTADGNETISVAYNDTSYLCNTDGGSSCPPAASNDYPLNGPNGIEYLDDTLLVAVSPTRLVKIDMATGDYTTVTQVPEGSIQGADGIILSADKSKLYIAGYGDIGSVMLLSSADNWDSGTMHTAYNAQCVNDGTTAVAIAQDSDVLIYCSNNFGPAPYNVSVLPGVVSLSGATSALPSSTLSSDVDVSSVGLVFDQQRNNVVLSNNASGNITGFPASLAGPTYSSSNQYTYLDGSATIYSSRGMQVSPSDPCYIYIAVGYVTAAQDTDTGISYTNICTGTEQYFYQLGAVTHPGSSLEDVVVRSDLEHIYITDAGYGTILSITHASSESKAVISALVSVADVCSQPNGIEITSDNEYLLVGCPEGLLRVDISSPSDYAFVTESSSSSTVSEMTQYFHALEFNADSTLLYGATNTGSASGTMYDRVVVLSSDDDWETCAVLYVFTADCPDGNAISLTFSPDDNMFILCKDADGASDVDAYINYIPSADDVVTDGNDVYSASSSSSSSSSNSKKSGNDDDDSDDVPRGYIAAVASLTVLCFILIVAVAVLLVKLCRGEHEALARQAGDSDIDL